MNRRTAKGKKLPTLEILEQPASRKIRFRKIDEPTGRLEFLEGINSTKEARTYPKIKINGYKGRAAVIASCVTKDPPYTPHPHNITGERTSVGGVYTVEASNTMIVEFKNLAIEFVDRECIAASLKKRRQARVDPFRTGFDHETRPQDIDLSTIRLCFQVFIQSNGQGTFNLPLEPVVTEPIYNNVPVPIFGPISLQSGPVSGGEEMIIICNQIHQDDISVRFFEKSPNGRIVWESRPDFQPEYIHRNGCIVIESPEYRDKRLKEPLQVHLQLRRPSDGATSESKSFTFLPTENENDGPSNRQSTVNNQADLYDETVQNKKLLHQLKGSYLVKVDHTNESKKDVTWDESARVRVNELRTYDTCEIADVYNVKFMPRVEQS